MQEANPYSNLSDVYSFGIVLYELLSATLPYSEYKSRDQILFLVGIGRLKPDMKRIRNDAPKRFRALLDNCITYKPEERPEFRDVSFFKLFFDTIAKVQYFQIFATLSNIRLHERRKTI